MGAMTDESSTYDRFAADRAVLALIGAALRDQPSGADVQLPAALADQAAAAWLRDEVDVLAEVETVEQRAVRDDAGVLALIGLAARDYGMTDAGNVRVPLDADLICAAVTAADRAANVTP
jgi:hypothetical protein